MKEYMEGLRWDTEKAGKVAEHGEPAHTETLYRTDNGRWFILYTFTKPGAAMNPINEDQALEWMKDHQLMTEMDDVFPGAIKDA